MKSLQSHSFPAPIWWIIFLGYFSCGKVTKVRFPFWGGGSRPRSCGQPGLQLGCEGNATTTLGILGMKYHVLVINQTTKVLTIARAVFWEGVCLERFVNTSLDFELFEYASGLQHVTVLYGCTLRFTDIRGQFTCRVNGVNETAAYTELGALGPSGCSASVVVPVQDSSSQQMGSISLSQVINQGFQAKYILQDEPFCVECEASGGRCPYDQKRNKISCLCTDGSARYQPCFVAVYKRGLTQAKLKIVIAASVSVTGIGILLLVLFYSRKLDSIYQLHKLLHTYTSDNKKIEDFLRTYGSLAPKRYNYKEMKKITSSFEKQLCEGGYDAVYKGKHWRN